MYTVFVRPSGKRIYKRVTLVTPKGKGKNVSELKKETVKQDKEEEKGGN